MPKSITTEANMANFLDAALQVAGIDAAFALGVPGHSSKTFWRWMKSETAMVAWPDRNSTEKILFRDAYALCRRMWRVTFDALLREAISIGDLYPATGPNGQIIYQEDAEILAEFGNTLEGMQRARELGVFDPPYVHETCPKTGKLRRVPLMVRRPAPATLRIHGARAMLGESGWNPSEKKEIDSRTQASVLVVGATQPALKPYHKDYKPPEQQQPQLEAPKSKSIEERIAEIHARNPNSALVKDLTARLSVPPQNPTPKGAHGERLDPRIAVQRGGANDPPELTGAKVAAEGKPQAPPQPQPTSTQQNTSAEAQPEPNLGDADKVFGREQQFTDTETAVRGRRLCPRRRD